MGKDLRNSCEEQNSEVNQIHACNLSKTGISNTLIAQLICHHATLYPKTVY